MVEFDYGVKMWNYEWIWGGNVPTPFPYKKIPHQKFLSLLEQVFMEHKKPAPENSAQLLEQVFMGAQITCSRKKVLQEMKGGKFFLLLNFFCWDGVWIELVANNILESGINWHFTERIFCPIKIYII
jgi:hypothetical protein